MPTEEPRFTAAEIEVLIETLLEGEVSDAAALTELTNILYTGLENSAAVRFLHDSAKRLEASKGRCAIEMAIHLAFQLGFRVRADLLDAEKLHELYAREG